MYCPAFALFAFHWDCAPAATELEVIVMCWLGKMLNLPSSYTSEEGGGMIRIHLLSSYFLCGTIYRVPRHGLGARTPWTCSKTRYAPSDKQD